MKHKHIIHSYGSSQFINFIEYNFIYEKGLRRMLDEPVSGKRGEEDIQSVGKARVKEICKVWGKRRRTYWTGQSGRMIFITIPATPDDGESARRRSRLNYISMDFGKLDVRNCSYIRNLSYLM